MKSHGYPLVKSYLYSIEAPHGGPFIGRKAYACTMPLWIRMKEVHTGVLLQYTFRDNFRDNIRENFSIALN